MSLKSIIRQKQILEATAQTEFEMPGEPMILSVKFDVGKRRFHADYFRNKKFRSILKCIFRAQYLRHQSVVIQVRFYVTPNEREKRLTTKQLKSEKVPAVFAYELCDYGLSFLQALMHTLFYCYKQIVKLDMEKYYSDNPRTVFKFLTWDQYVKLQSGDTIRPESKSKRKNKHPEGSSGVVQSVVQGNGADEGVCPAAASAV